jgi:EpsI family protein
MTTRLLRSVITILLLGATIGAAHYMDRRRPDSLAAPLETISPNLQGWTAENDPPLPEATLASLKPTSYLARQYSKAGAHIGLFIAYYDQQRSGESMHSPKHCLPANGWEIWNTTSALVPVDGAPVKINQYSIQHTGQRAVVFYWYQSRERIIASEYLGKILLVRDSLLTGRTAGSIVRLMIEDRPEAVTGGLEFASLIIPEIQRCFGR